MKIANLLWLSAVLVGANSFAQTNAGNGTIMIEKESTTDDTAEFEFRGLDGFTLTGGTAKIAERAAGTYVITELPKDGWKVTDIWCDLENDPDSTVSIHAQGDSAPEPGTDAAAFDAGDRSVTINLAAGEVVECHFVNEEVGGIKIIKRVKHNGFERIPEDGFEFVADLAADDELDELFSLRDGTIKLFQDAPQGLNTFLELAPFVTNLNDELVESTSWDISKIECRCVKTSADDECTSTWTVDLDDGSLLLDPDDEDSARRTLGSVTVDLKGGELVICEVTNEDNPCPPGTGSQSGGTGTNNGGSTAGTNTNAGLATTDVGASAGGCSSTGTGVAGLSTILLLLSSLVGVRAMRRVRVKN